MVRYLAAALLGLCLSAPSFAADTAGTAKENPQVNKMRTCAQEYRQRGIPKNEYRTFMSFCLKKDYVLGSYVPGTTAAPTPSAAKETAAAPAAVEPELTGREKQKNKMKTCNAEAKEQKLKGTERKEFMKACLSAD